MKRTHTAWLASALLRFVASENEALAGDLLEERHAGRSGGWFWGQLARAVLVTTWQKRRTTLVGIRVNTAPTVDRPNRSLAPLSSATLNLSGIRVQGIGGLGLIAVVLLITFTMPAAWWLAAMGLSSGIVLGIFLIIHRRGVGLAGSGGGHGPLTLFGGVPSGDNGAEAGERTASRTGTSPPGARPPCARAAWQSLHDIRLAAR